VACRCQQCNNQYTIDIIVQDEIWEKIKPPGKPKEGGLLCGGCIIKNLENIANYSAFILKKVIQ
jgi:hypothetical protein